MSSFTFHPDAERDLDGAATWYETQKPGLGRQFRKAVDTALSSIRLTPYAYPRIHGLFRRFVVRRFPYSIVYLPQDGMIYIVTISHSHRDPAHWQKRL